MSTEKGESLRSFLFSSIDNNNQYYSDRDEFFFVSLTICLYIRPFLT